MLSVLNDIKTAIQPKIITGKLLPEEVRTRFAPSPTGFLHIGGLRTALYNYLVAKHYKGKFLIRIEDTDRARIAAGAFENIFETLQWAGLEWDEGPILEIPNPKLQIPNKSQISNSKLGTKGKFGPYIQSERLDIYKKYAEELVAESKAYYCFCTAERLEKMRAEQTAKKIPTRYDRTCRDLKPEEIEEKLKSGAPHVIRFKTPLDGETIVDDLIRGIVKFKNSLIDDYVLLKSDGFPTYHLASVSDDYLMEITHIIRGEEWLPSAGLHKLLYEAFGWQAPYFAHLPIILAPGGGKLSKRQGDVAVSDYIAKGYLPEALLNFILFLGWNPGDEREIFGLEEMISEFTLDKIGKSGAIFDLKKLDWMNGWYIRKMDLSKLTELCLPYLIKAGYIEQISNFTLRQAQGDKRNIRDNKNVMVSLSNHDIFIFNIVKTGEDVNFEWLEKVVALEQERMKKLSDIAESTKYFFVDVPEYDAALLKWKKMTPVQIKSNLEETSRALEHLDAWRPSKSELEVALKPLMEKLGVGETLWPLRVALSGAKASPSPFEIAEVLGKEKVLKRIKAGIEKIG